MYDNLPWNKPKYKPETKICDLFWEDFIHVATILRRIDKNMTAREKQIRNWQEPDIYAVFDKMRQDYFDELPYNMNRLREIDRSIEREVAKELREYE